MVPAQVSPSNAVPSPAHGTHQPRAITSGCKHGCTQYALANVTTRPHRLPDDASGKIVNTGSPCETPPSGPHTYAWSCTCTTITMLYINSTVSRCSIHHRSISRHARCVACATDGKCNGSSRERYACLCKLASQPMYMTRHK